MPSDFNVMIQWYVPNSATSDFFVTGGSAPLGPYGPSMTIGPFVETDFPGGVVNLEQPLGTVVNSTTCPGVVIPSG